MIEVYKRNVPIAAWNALFCNFVEPLAGGVPMNPHVRQGWKASFTVHSEGRKPDAMAVSFEVHAPDDTPDAELKALRERWNKEFNDWNEKQRLGVNGHSHRNGIAR